MQVTLPVAIGLSLLSTSAGVGIAWGAASARATAAESSHYKLERRVDKLEDAMAAVRPMLERIDERTARIERTAQNSR